MHGTLGHTLIMNGKSCVGVKVGPSGRIRKKQASENIYAKEVILSGGAFNTPQTLLLSGIGPRKQLENVGLECIHHLPGVGQNLQDHLQIKLLNYCKKPVCMRDLQFKMFGMVPGWLKNSADSQLGSGALITGGFTRSSPDMKHADIQHHFCPAEIKDHGKYPGFVHAFADHLCAVQPKSMGSVTLKSKNPHEHPLIDPNYFDEEQDIVDYVNGFKQGREIMKQSALNEYNGGEKTPGNKVQSDKEIIEYLRGYAETCYHPTSSCRIGADDFSVCDSDFKVKEIIGLRIADASAMPDVISGNTNASSILMGEMCAESILS